MGQPVVLDSKSLCGPPLGGVLPGWGRRCVVLAPKFSLHLHSYLARCLAGLLGPWDLGVVWLSLIAFVVSPGLVALGPGA